MRTVVHPGPVGTTRLELVPCDGRETMITLEAGMPLETAVAKALEPLGFDSAWLELSDAAVDKLHYVIPALSKDNEHAAWYSDVHRFAQGHIDHIGMIVGRHNGVSFLHGHGLWQPAGGKQAMGHILAPHTVLSAPVSATCLGLSGACFNRRMDEETNFTLFRIDPPGLQPTDHDQLNQGADMDHPNPGANSDRQNPQRTDNQPILQELQNPSKSWAFDNRLNQHAKEFAALRVLPNQEFESAINTACLSLGWAAARVFGLGSLVGACFEDGNVMDSLPTEFLITDFIAGKGGGRPEIVIVGIDGSRILSGRLSQGKNAVLITAELVLMQLD